MGISRYLAMTAAEIESFPLPDGHVLAYMACHFSPYSTGLSNVPDRLPPGSMLILNDRTPISGHDPKKIADQLLEALETLHYNSILLDFQRPHQEALHTLCRQLETTIPCPVGVSDLYAKSLSCPVFLPPPPLDQPLAEYTAPWEGREIWLDTAPDAACIAVTESGSNIEQLPFSSPPDSAHTDEALHCRYQIELFENKARFLLWRDLPQIEALLEEAQTIGITKCIGLFQQLCIGK